ncbi:MAG: methyltransferase domain-containing protein [Gammaproteobacteria bacterium]|nr:methyltransferase domain-containing protein [Gammaproteobacteria bacterium]MCY4217970.1 methyltransferase domain-containing protein [Gammaproteobacteria bacterium]
MDRWLKSPVGKSVIQAETATFSELVPLGFYARSLQIGMPEVHFLEGIESRERYIVTEDGPSVITHDGSNRKQDRKIRYMIARPFALPFPERSQNLIVLPHTIDHCENPHDVLREVNEILEPEGCLVIIGFNIFSIYGCIHSLLRKSDRMPWNGKFYSTGRVQDWLLLLGYDLIGARMIIYRPPINSERYQNKMKFLEKAGNRWWPGLGGVYIIVGKKREMTLTLNRKLSSAWTKFLPTVVRPAPQKVARTMNKEVINSE